MKRGIRLAAMQELKAKRSLIAQAFGRITPPTGPFEVDGDWCHVYEDISSFNLKSRQGRLTIRHNQGGVLQIESYRRCPDEYRYYTQAEVQCDKDALATPLAWTVKSKVAKRAEDDAYLNSGICKTFCHRDGTLVGQTGDKKQIIKMPGRYSCKWCLLHLVSRMAIRDRRGTTFTLLDEFDEACPGQEIRLQGRYKVKTREEKIKVTAYQHTGTATLPGVFYVDIEGRVLFYLAGMQLLALASADGKETGYLK